jgi:hypothetical protein
MKCVLRLGLFTMDGFLEVKKFIVCMKEEKTNDLTRQGEGGGMGSDLSIQMLQDVLYEQPQ